MAASWWFSVISNAAATNWQTSAATVRQYTDWSEQMMPDVARTQGQRLQPGTRALARAVLIVAPIAVTIVTIQVLAWRSGYRLSPAVVWSFTALPVVVLAVLVLRERASARTRSRSVDEAMRYLAAIDRLVSPSPGLRAAGIADLQDLLRTGDSMSRAHILETVADYLRDYGRIDGRREVIPDLVAVLRDNTELVAAHGPLNLAGAHLAGADLRNLHWAGVLFAGADLSNADLRGTVLTGADMTSATLTDTDLTGVDLSTVRGVTTGRHPLP